jgi:hypothetical protein
VVEIVEKNRGHFLKIDFKKAPQGNIKALPCFNFNQMKCQHGADRESANILWWHICVCCLNEGHIKLN